MIIFVLRLSQWNHSNLAKTVGNLLVGEIYIFSLFPILWKALQELSLDCEEGVTFPEPVFVGVFKLTESSYSKMYWTDNENIISIAQSCISSMEPRYDDCRILVHKSDRGIDHCDSGEPRTAAVRR